MQAVLFIVISFEVLATGSHVRGEMERRNLLLANNISIGLSLGFIKALTAFTFRNTVNP